MNGKFGNVSSQFHHLQQHHLQQLQTEHNTLLQQLPHLQDLQASWLMLPYCASPRCNYQLRMLPPQCHPPVCSGPRCSRRWLPGRNARLQPTTRYRPCHSPPTTPVRRSRTHIGQHTRNASLLGVMGRCLTSSGPTNPATSSHPPPPVPKRGTADVANPGPQKRDSILIKPVPLRNSNGQSPKLQPTPPLHGTILPTHQHTSSRYAVHAWH